MVTSFNDFTLKKNKNNKSPFWVMVNKEVSDYIRSWQFIILLSLIVLTFLGSMYVSMDNIKAAVYKAKDPDHLFIFLKLLTVTDGSLPPFHVFINFLGPLLGISLGFNAINAEENKGTLTRIMAQPVYRDNLILSKYVSAILLVSVTFLSLTLLMIGGGILLTGILIEPEEVLRILFYVIICIFYVGFWLSLSILFSVKLKQAAASALTAIGVWLFFTVFYRILVTLLVTAFLSDGSHMTFQYSDTLLSILRLAPSQLYADATTTLLMPTIRSLGPVSMQQMAGAIPGPLPVDESLMIVWPQASGLIAASIVSFALTYYFFMRKEIKS